MSLYTSPKRERGELDRRPPRSRFGLVFPDVFQLAVRVTAEKRNFKASRRWCEAYIAGPHYRSFG
jgi:hypothetical protein